MTIIIAAMLVAGCAAKQKIWTKDGGTQEAFMRDQIQCRQLGMQSAMANGLAGNAFVELWIQKEVDSCMQALGYSFTIQPAN